MNSFSLRQFSKVETLQKISRENLISFLMFYGGYFAGHGLKIPPVISDEEINYAELSRILQMPDSTTPQDLTDALFYIDELSTPEGFDAIQRKIEGTELDAAISKDASFADLAIQVWMCNPHMIENIHMEQYLYHLRSFDYFQSVKKTSDGFEKPSQKVLDALQRDINEWFYKKRRGRSARISIYVKPHDVWFIIRHGEPFVRQNVVESDGESRSFVHRPEKYDVLIYKINSGEIKMNTCSKTEKELFRRMVGLHIFGSEEHFVELDKFTLEPLRTLGPAALLCHDVEGMDEVKLKELQLSHGGRHREMEIRKAGDIFAAFGERCYKLPSDGIPVKAGFSIKFSGTKKPRTISFGIGCNVQYKRDIDAGIIEEWLRKRGFIISGG